MATLSSETQEQADLPSIQLPPGFEVGTALTGTGTHPINGNGYIEPIDLDHISPVDARALVSALDSVDEAVVDAFRRRVESHSRGTSSEEFVDLGHSQPDKLLEIPKDTPEAADSQLVLDEASDQSRADMLNSLVLAAQEAATSRHDVAASPDAQ